MSTVLHQCQINNLVDNYSAALRQRRHPSHNNATTHAPSPGTTPAARDNNTSPNQAPQSLPHLIALVRASASFQKILKQWQDEDSHSKERTLIANYASTKTPSSTVLEAMVKGVQAAVAGWRADGTFSDRVQKTVEHGKDRLRNYLSQAETTPKLKEDSVFQDVQEIGGEQAVVQSLKALFMSDWENHIQQAQVVLYMYAIAERTFAERSANSTAM
jgi:hypothetical protein